MWLTWKAWSSQTMDGRYKQLKADLNFIAEEIKQFPEKTLLEKVFDFLASGLRNTETQQTIIPEVITEGVAPHQTNQQESESIATTFLIQEGTELDEFLTKHKSVLASTKNYEFATVIAFYYQMLAPESEHLTEIGSKLLSESFLKAGKRPPAEPSNILNAARKKKWLDTGGKRGVFKITDLGAHIANQILNRGDNTND